MEEKPIHLDVQYRIFPVPTSSKVMVEDLDFAMACLLQGD